MHWMLKLNITPHQQVEWLSEVQFLISYFWLTMIKKPSSTIMYVQLADVYGSVLFVYSIECYTALLFHFIFSIFFYLSSSSFGLFCVGRSYKNCKEVFGSCICRSQSLLQQYLWTKRTTCMLLDQTTRTFYTI